MPVYRYECKECGHIFELALSVEDRNSPLRGLCSLCDAAAIVRNYTPVLFKLKGDCWARDNYIRDHDKAEHFNKQCEESQ